MKNSRFSTNIILVDHCWMVTRGHHLDDRLSLSHVSRPPTTTPCRRNKQYPLINGAAMHQWTIIVRKSPKLCRRQIVQKTFYPPPRIWRPLKISLPKVEKPTYGAELYRHANFHADRPNCPRTIMLYIFRKFSSSWF